MPGTSPNLFNSSLFKMTLVLACACIGFIGMALGQTAQNISIYTSTAEKDCRIVEAGTADDSGGTRVCRGPAGLVVMVSEGDLRETVSVGRNRKAAASEPAAQDRFGPFNSTTPTIEWRLPGKDKPPFAMIQRWHIADIEDEGKDGRPIAKQLLVVTRLSPGPVCRVAYVDVKANPNANDLAREAADTVARDFRCGTDKVKVIGASGRAVELALPR
ncbi:MAG: hypothetical protein ACRC9K_10840 [Afipia sp.]